MAKSENVITGIVERELRELAGPMACSQICHDDYPLDHHPECPAEDGNRVRAFGLAVAKAVVREAAKLAPHDGDCLLRSPGVDQECHEECPHANILALAAPRRADEGR